ncbi:C-terminal binding protein [Anaerotruncus colihominis]|uniref:C-terminal binding protein n=1 Tax=Anaerotruncus colihominis TaxID=169435 RepID=UPI00189A7595|nr:C-terminal binding protein [Anaerotruncus colihominis]
MSIKLDHKPVVVLTDYMYDSIQPFQDVYDRAGFDFRPHQCRTSEEIIRAARDADAVQVHFAQLTREVINALPKCRLIVRSAVGMDNIDVAAATAAGIPVANVPDYGIEDVSTHAILLMLAITKKLNILTRTVREGVWDYALTKPVHRIQDQVFGLMGCGAIARCAARKAQAFGMKVIAYDPYLKQEQVSGLGITLKPAREVARESDVVSIHLPLTGETKETINREFFSWMKPGAFLINTARGGVIQEQDLLQALQAGQIAGAGLDVLAQEHIEKDNPLLQLDNVIITPHAAWYSEEAEFTLLTSAAEEVVRGLNGEPLKHPFNRIPYAKQI